MSQTTSASARKYTFEGRHALMLLIVIMMFGFWISAYSLERIDLEPFLRNILGDETVALFPRPFIAFAGLFHWRVLRHLIPVVIGIYLAYRAAVGLIKTLYDLPEEEDATKFLQRLRASSPVGIGAVTVKSNTLEEERTKSISLRVGGPVTIKIGADDAVVTELNGRFHRVLAAGSHNLERFETVHSVHNLRVQERTITDVLLLTKDGIELTADLAISYRIKQGSSPTTQKTFPFDEKAVRQAAYYSRVLANNQVSTWETFPIGQARSLLYDTIAESTLDEILEPVSASTEPYLVIHNSLENGLQEKLETIGVTLISVHITRLELPQPVVDQVIDHWQSHWETRRQIQTAEGEADAKEEVEMARTQAEIFMVKAIAESVKLAREQGGNNNMREIVALRLIEALEGMTRHSQRIDSRTEPITRDILPRLTTMRHQVAPPYLNPGNDEEQS